MLLWISAIDTIMCVWSQERTGRVQFFLDGANKKGCLWFFSFFDVYGFLI